LGQSGPPLGIVCPEGAATIPNGLLSGRYWRSSWPTGNVSPPAPAFRGSQLREIRTASFLSPAPGQHPSRDSILRIATHTKQRGGTILRAGRQQRSEKSRRQSHECRGQGAINGSQRQGDSRKPARGSTGPPTTYVPRWASCGNGNRTLWKSLAFRKWRKKEASRRTNCSSSPSTTGEKGRLATGYRKRVAQPVLLATEIPGDSVDPGDRLTRPNTDHGSGGRFASSG
jgi:hypothetical protein